MHPQPPRYPGAQAIPSAGLALCEDRADDQEVGLVVDAEFVGQELQGQKQVRGRGRLRRKGEVAEHVGGQNRADLEPEGDGVLVARADRRVQSQGAGLAHAQNDFIAFPGGELPGQGFVDERSLTCFPLRDCGLSTLELTRSRLGRRSGVSSSGPGAQASRGQDRPNWPGAATTRLHPKHVDAVGARGTVLPGNDPGKRQHGGLRSSRQGLDQRRGLESTRIELGG